MEKKRTGRKIKKGKKGDRPVSKKRENLGDHVVYLRRCKKKIEDCN